MNGFGGRDDIAGYTIDPVCLCMKIIIAHFKSHIPEDQGTCRHPHCQSHDIDERKKLVAQEIPDSNFEIVFYHTPLAAKKVPLLHLLINQLIIHV
jgi:hypothetical protein